MLPNPNFKWKKQPEIHVWRKHSNGEETSVDLESYRSNGCITLFEDALKNNEVLSRVFHPRILLHFKVLSIIGSFFVLPYSWTMMEKQ